MLGNEAHATTKTVVLNPASLSAGANNGTYTSVSEYEGDVLFVVSIGAITGSVIVKIVDATDGSGTGVGDVTGAVTAALSTANTATSIIVPASKLRSHARPVATVTTGPAVMGVTMIARPKYTA